MWPRGLRVRAFPYTVMALCAVAREAIARRKGTRLYAYGRGDGSQPMVVVLSETRAGWRPRTAWEMDEVERRWWRKQGGR